MRVASFTLLGSMALSILSGPADAATTVQAQTFGAVGDGKTDDWWAIQRGINDLASHGGGTLSLPPTPANTYVIRQALRMRSNVVVDVPQPDTTIKCKARFDTKGAPADPTGLVADYVSQWGFTGCINFGSVMNPQNEQALTSLALDPAAQQGAWVTLAEKAEAAGLKAGDLVIAASSGSFKVGAEPIPTWGEMDRVEEVDAARGRVRLRYSTGKRVPIACLKWLTESGKFWQRAAKDTASDRSVGVPIWASWRSGVTGGTWIGMTDNGNATPFAIGGGGLDCILKPHGVTASFGVGYGNLFSRCAMSVESETITASAFELAYLSNGNTVTIGSIMMKNGGKPFGWVLAFDEGAHDNAVSVDSIEIADPGIKDVVLISTARNNNAKIGTINGAPITGSVVFMHAFNFSGDYPKTEGNAVTVTNSTIKSAGAPVAYGGFSVENNTVRDSTFVASPKGLAVGVNTAIGNVVSNVKAQ